MLSWLGTLQTPLKSSPFGFLRTTLLCSQPLRGHRLHPSISLPYPPSNRDTNSSLSVFFVIHVASWWFGFRTFSHNVFSLCQSPPWLHFPEGAVRWWRRPPWRGITTVAKERLTTESRALIQWCWRARGGTSRDIMLMTCIDASIIFRNAR